jgi:hypothetical protein
MINITCTSVADNLPVSLYEQYLSLLPVEMQYKNRRFRYLQQLNIDTRYCACVATDKSEQTISVEKIPWPTLFQ